MYLVTEDRLRNLESARGHASVPVDDILGDPGISSRNKVFALADAHDRMVNAAAPQDMLKLPSIPIASSVERSLLNNLDRRAETIVSMVGKSQKNSAEKFVRYLREIGMDITDSMEPMLNQLVLPGANICDLVHWVTNPVNQPLRPRELEAFMRILSRNCMPATLITNKDRRMMYVSLQSDEIPGPPTSAIGSSRPSNGPHRGSAQDTSSGLASSIFQQSGGGAVWTFY